ncbi:MAG TPA: hypothetical protein VFD59_10810 [Nocardioidaceae bacterium]|nr:hypothetical protein [Nocardioidaceae bacterium]
MNDEDNRPLRSVLIGLAALVGASVLIGGLVSVMALGLADFAGVGGGDSADSEPSAEPSLFMPSPSEATPGPDEQEGTDGSDGSGATDPTRRPERRQITLTASPTTVSPLDRINLDGRYPNGSGATLQVQRFAGGWTDFPVTATVQNGTFSTYIQTGQTGQNRFRVLDESSGRSSKPVTVTIGG